MDKKERTEALNLIQSKLDEIVPYLKGLDSRLKPELEHRFNFFSVGVDVTQTAAMGSIAYDVIVYSTKPLSRNSPTYLKAVVDLQTIIEQVEPEYPGDSRVATLPMPYPSDSFLNLQFLEDLMESQR